MVRMYVSIGGIVICYPYITVNPMIEREALNYIKKCRHDIISILVDTGVDTLFKRYNLVDYPEWYIPKYIEFIKAVTARASNDTEVLYTIPDVPVDYDGREKLYPWNVERTLEYIELFKAKYINLLRPAKPVPVVQGAKDDIDSIIRTYKENKSLFDEFEIIGLGPTCHTRNWRKLGKMILAFDRVVNRPFHSFGAHIKAIIWVLQWNPKHFRSFDTSAFYRTNNKMVNGRIERTESLVRYIQKIMENGVY